jgi:diacylglycerol O-acyltransferase
MLDPTPAPREVPNEPWRPAHTPSGAALVAGAVTDLVRRPTRAVSTAWSAVLDVRATAERVSGLVGGVASSLRSISSPAPDSPLNVRIGQQRRFGMAATDLDDYRRIRAAHGGTVNDVVLATVTGALRTWLLTRGEPVLPQTTIRALVPVSVHEQSRGGVGNRVATYVVDLPVGESSPFVRLQQVSFAMRGHQESGRSVGADALVQLSGFAPPTIHSLGARVVSGMTRRLFNLVVTNVPGPQFPLYAAGARMLSIYPVVPLAKGQAVSIGLTSYDGGVYYGLNADRDAMPDVDVLASCLEESLAELGEGAAG